MAKLKANTVKKTTETPKAKPKVKKKDKGEIINPLSVKGLFGQTLIDAGNNDEGWTILYFSNDHELRVKGNVFLVVKESEKVKK